jgi:hypothetical protein
MRRVCSGRVWGQSPDESVSTPVARAVAVPSAARAAVAGHVRGLSPDVALVAAS